MYLESNSICRFLLQEQNWQAQAQESHAWQMPAPGLTGALPACMMHHKILLLAEPAKAED